ncbi:hypothetical protein [Yoonia sediminilitoris]|uniref:Uncharacterized protein n=1 Tax=Yoonia sediminilitoris TaxID=1286148 RepID=A0A2T6K4P8_9RHOB|nr:hypothetical protein [Yoonia sediminilitoris]PUB09594.1 hypothetical protein C8N45_12811 [Yoonia sediminilitoris]RCW89516.1 hypothetical protein DFP92_12811 [Yoonia sediminilitoris]
MTVRRGPRTVTRDTVNWKLIDDHVIHGTLLDEADIQRLALKHDVKEQALRQASVRLRSAFLKEMVLSQPELFLERRRVGKVKLAEISRLMAIADGKLQKALRILDDVGFSNPFAHAGMPNPADRYREEFENAVCAIDECRRFFNAAESEDLARFLATPDGNKAVDMRRTILCVTLFNLWLDLGRSVTYTTDNILEERTGPLIEFVRDVIFCLSDPPTRHNGEAVKREIDAFNRGVKPSDL